MPAHSQKGSLFWINFFTGITDGIVLPFAVSLLIFPFVPGIGALLSVAFLVALLGCAVFGLARYFGELSEIQHHHPLLSHEETVKEQALMQHIGIEQALRQDMEKAMEKEKQQWLREIKENGLEWEKLDKKRAFRSAFQTALGFLTGGIAMLLPVYFIIHTLFPVHNPDMQRLFYCCSIPLLILFFCGGLKATYTGKAFWKGACYTLLYGFLAFLSALLVARFLLHKA